MKHRLAALILSATGAWAGAWAQVPEPVVQERARIASERSQAEMRFATEEKSCYGTFAVNSCVEDARKRRRGTLAGLRALELSLNDAERKRETTQRLKKLEDRASPEKQAQAAAERAKAVADQQLRETRTAEENAARSAKANRSADPAHERGARDTRHQPRVKTPPQQKAVDTADNQRRHRQRTEEAAAHRAQVEKRMAERTKRSSPLPPQP